MKKRWVLNESPNEEEILELSKEINCSPIIANLLLQRGVRTKNDANAFFSPSLKNLHDPFLMKDMDKAVERLDEALSKGEKILIYGDYDVDGTTAVALLYKYLKDKCQSGTLSYCIPDRYNDGYGVSINSINDAKDNGVKLMIITDCGIKDNDKVEYAKQRGIDIIICDHHTTGDEIPKAVAVLDPQREDCPYPYKWLSGCGVSFKMIQAHSIKHGYPMDKVYSLLDLLSVSIAGDIVPITGENRILAYYGLKQLNTNPSLGLKTIINTTAPFSKDKLPMQGSGCNNDITINDIVFRIGPRINAAGRIESGETSVDLLVADSPKKAFSIAQDINKLNDERKKLDHDITEEAKKAINMADKDISNKKMTTVLFNPEWHKGVVAIVASRLTEIYYRPTIVMTESNGFATGSARSVEGFDLYSAISQCSDLLENYGGHKYAAGLTMKKENIEAFKERFENVVRETISTNMRTPQINIDAAISLSDINTEMYETLQKFAPFGPYNNIPVFETDNVVNYLSTKRVGRRGEHLKLDVADNTDKPGTIGTATGIGFGMGKYYEPIKKADSFDICFCLQENLFMGKKDIQMLIKDIHMHDDSDVSL